MPGSLARKERRRKEREGLQIPRTTKAPYAEIFNDEGEPQGGMVQAAEEGIHFSRDDDILSLGRGDATHKDTHSHRQRAAQVSPTLAGQEANGGNKYQQRSKRGPPPRIPRDSEPPLGSLYNYSPSVYEEAMETLRNMTPEDSVRLRNVVINQMAAEGVPWAIEADLDEAQRDIFPMYSIKNPPWGPSRREGDVMTNEEADNLSLAMFNKISSTMDQSSCTVPSATDLKASQSADYSVLQAVGGNVDGASQSVEIVTPEKEAPLGQQAHIVSPKGDKNHTGVESGLQALSNFDSPALPSTLINREALNVDIKTTNDENVEHSSGVPDREKIDKAQAAPEIIPTVEDLEDHTDRVARIDDMTEKLRQSVEKAMSGIRPASEGVKLDRGSTQHGSSSDYASSSVDSEDKPCASRTRRITNDGILELKASPFKIDPAKLKHKDHRRKVSLKLPINVFTPRRAYTRSSTQVTHSPSLSTDEGVPPSYEAEERELEYKHRHIFIGTASLDDFLEILEVTPTYTTTKRQVVKAFGILACAEQVQARQSSLSSDGWNFVTRTTHDNILTNTDYLNEAHVKLGSISLGTFLGRIPFNNKGEITATKVVEAFCLASHLDGEATYGMKSKAKAFRSWLVRENAAAHNS